MCCIRLDRIIGLVVWCIGTLEALVVCDHDLLEWGLNSSKSNARGCSGFRDIGIRASEVLLQRIMGGDAKCRYISVLNTSDDDPFHMDPQGSNSHMSTRTRNRRTRNERC